jgi:hypothetical protein
LATIQSKALMIAVASSALPVRVVVTEFTVTKHPGVAQA